MAADPTEQSQGQRREVILTAALAAFNEQGVAGTSIEEIRRRSGASVGSIYHHFGGKDELAGALYLEGLSHYQAGFISVLAGSRSTRSGVEGAVRHHVSWISEHRDLARFLLLGRDASLVVATERPLRELNRRFFTAVRDWTRPRVQAGELRELSPEVTTALWIGPSQELSRHWLAGNTRIDLAGSAAVLATAAWLSLKEES
jgi:AcrR family transcriptional regulator